MDSNIELIMRQTNYNEKIAKEKLKFHNNNIIKVIEEYLDIIPKTDKPKMVSVNQEKYRQFRNLVSETNKNIRKQKPNSL